MNALGAVFVNPVPLVVTVISFAEITALSTSFSIVITLNLSISMTGDTWEFDVLIVQFIANIPFVLEVIILVFARVMFCSVLNSVNPTKALAVFAELYLNVVVVLLNCIVESVVLKVS